MSEELATGASEDLSRSVAPQHALEGLVESFHKTSAGGKRRCGDGVPATTDKDLLLIWT